MPNRLARETSPYLRQHADNPVDWWPWCDEALAKARSTRTPILLSVGYAACHWCHVMAHECFEDEAVARVMNALYINIKVDREERPDIDRVYQLAHQALARRGGGWPLTVFLTPDDLLPFFAGTYFPKTPRYNMPGFVQVLEGVRRWYDDKPDEVRAQNGALAQFLSDYGNENASEVALDDRPIRTALHRVADDFDRVNGGHRGAPKFPHASEIELLLAHADNDSAATPSPREMAALTLERMALGGIDDHLGGGFFRYSVDAQWEIPHFEKMLYDNALLLPLYARAAAIDAGFAHPARAIASWVVDEMVAPGGGFHSSLDADSEGEEGRYYVWQRDEVRALLGADEYAVAEARYGFDRAPNFEGEAWHAVVSASLEDIAARTSLEPGQVRERLGSAVDKLLAARSLRQRPALDDKILTSWNALMIAGAARAMRRIDGLDALGHEAERALDLIHAQLWRDGRLYASHARGETRFPAYLDDHAFLIDASLTMLQLRWNRRDLDTAIALADILLERFEDRDRGGFFFTAHDAEALPQRPKPWMDEALPSGNGVAARSLLRLGHLLGEARYLEAAERTLRAAWPTLGDHPQACCSLLLALGEFLSPPPHIVVHRHDGESADWADLLRTPSAEDVDIYSIPAGEEALPGVLAAQVPVTRTTAFVCRGSACEAPIETAAALAASLRAHAM